MINVSYHKEFIDWLTSLKNEEAKRRISTRLARMQMGNFGDHKSLGNGLYELRIDFGQGYRIYYKQVGQQIYLLLIGGDKTTQTSDIVKAQKIASNLRAVFV